MDEMSLVLCIQVRRYAGSERNLHMSRYLRNLKEYIIAASGSVIGGIAVAIIGLYLAQASADIFVPEAKHSKAGPIDFVLEGALVGFCVGEVGGCWLALHLGRYPKSFLTAAILGFFLFLWLLLIFQRWKYLDSLLHSYFPIPSDAIFFLFLSLPLLARYLSNLLGRRG